MNRRAWDTNNILHASKSGIAEFKGEKKPSIPICVILTSAMTPMLIFFLTINKICQFRLFLFIANQVINNTDVTTISSPFPVQEVYNYYATHN